MSTFFPFEGHDRPSRSNVAVSTTAPLANPLTTVRAEKGLFRDLGESARE